MISSQGILVSVPTKKKNNLLQPLQLHANALVQGKKTNSFGFLSSSSLPLSTRTLRRKSSSSNSLPLRRHSRDISLESKNGIDCAEIGNAAQM